MATKVYGENQLPGDVVTVRSGSTVAISLGFNATLGLIGNMDVSNGSATQGDVEYITDTTDAIDAFGDGSELHRAVEIAFANGVADIQAIGVSESETTESFAASSTGTLSNVPVADPRVAPEHTVTATDTTDSSDVSVTFVYGESSPSTPSDPDTIALNTQTGEWTADTSSDYDITYTYGDYSTAIPKLLDKNIRFACVLTENESIGNDLLSELNSHAQQFDFMRGVIGGMPETLPADYTDAIDEQRMVIVEGARSYAGEADTEEVRTAVAVAGHLTSRPLSESATGEIHGKLDGLVSLNQDLTPGEGADFVSDHQVLPVRRSTNIYIAKDVTTSTDVRFERVFTDEIVDEVALTHHLIAEQFVGSLNFEERRDELEASLDVPLEDMASDNPPLLDDFVVNVSKGASDFEVDCEVGLDVIGVMDRINVNITVGDVTTLEDVN